MECKCFFFGPVPLFVVVFTLDLWKRKTSFLTGFSLFHRFLDPCRRNYGWKYKINVSGALAAIDTGTTAMLVPRAISDAIIRVVTPFLVFTTSAFLPIISLSNV